MSRYTYKPDFLTEYAWGYDEPLEEYFLECFKTIPLEGEEEPVYMVGTKLSAYPHPDYPDKIALDKNEILLLMEPMGFIPEEHKLAITNGIPF